MGRLGVAALGFALSIVTTSPADGLSEQELWESFDTLMGVADGWEAEREADGIRVYVRDVPISPIKSFRGVMEIDTNLSALTAFLMDTEVAPAYVRLCERATIVGRVSDTEVYMHSLNRPGWPAAPRDSIVHCKWSQDPDTLTVTERCVGVPDYLPEQEGFVRVPLLATLLRITPKENGKLELALEAVAETGGWIPSWLVNIFVVDTPFSTLAKIRDMMPFDAYEGRPMSWLREPPRPSEPRTIAMP